MTEMISGLPGPLAAAVFFAASLFPLVLIHEIGHFIAAKLNKVRVDEFGIGFPPRLARLAKIGDTEYTVNILPLGGFVRMAGEDDPDIPDSFAGKSKRARSVILLAGPFANFLFAAAVFASMAMVGLFPQAVFGIDGVEVSQVNEGSPAEAAGLVVGDIIVATNGEALVAPENAEATSEDEMERIALAVEELVKRTDASADKPMELTVVRGGLERVEDVDEREWSGKPTSIQGVSGVEVTSAPASSALHVGDVVLEPQGEDGSLIVLRSPESVVLVVTPKRSSPDAPGQMGVAIGTPSIATRFGLVAALGQGVGLTGRLLHAMITTLARMFVGRAEVELAGPVGISIMSRQMGEQGMVSFLRFMALLSLNLGLINLLPIPALDGGRLLFIAAEAVRGKRVEPSREAVVHLIGFVLVIGLMAAITVVEVARLTGLTGP